MFRKFIILCFSSFLSVASFCHCSSGESHLSHPKAIRDSIILSPIVAAEQVNSYLPFIKGKKTGLVVNHTSMVKNTHLLDTLLRLGIPVAKAFAPEHGFRGKADAGEKVGHEKDPASGTPIISLYGKNKKPSAEQLKGLDILVFDMQDVGARFYTYYSTMFYLMQAAAENNIPVLILDRPNPNGHYVDGPVLDTTCCKSFIGLLPLPVVHGLTLGEMAHMINGEGWLGNNLKCNITVIPVKHYNHSTPYSLPVKPSPNLPNDQAIQLYPSLCLFEGTKMSLGRGTDFPFQVIGGPDPAFGSFTFTPVRLPWMAADPVLNNKLCYGLDLRNVPPKKFTLEYLIDMYQKDKNKATFFIPFFENLIGNKAIRLMIEKGESEETIKASWQKELNAYKSMRKKYLLYSDFE